MGRVWCLEDIIQPITWLYFDYSIFWMPLLRSFVIYLTPVKFHYIFTYCSDLNVQLVLVIWFKCQFIAVNLLRGRIRPVFSFLNSCNIVIIIDVFDFIWLCAQWRHPGTSSSASTTTRLFYGILNDSAFSKASNHMEGSCIFHINYIF